MICSWTIEDRVWFLAILFYFVCYKGAILRFKNVYTNSVASVSILVLFYFLVCYNNTLITFCVVDWITLKPVLGGLRDVDHKRYRSLHLPLMNCPIKPSLEFFNLFLLKDLTFLFRWFTLFFYFDWWVHLLKN
jgi:hypothetical protein